VTTQGAEKMTEAKIVINGVTLSVAQSMTLRVALSAWDRNCGDDEHGKLMAMAYTERTGELLRLIHEAIQKGDTVE
jgi:hypothetical protein